MILYWNQLQHNEFILGIQNKIISLLGYPLLNNDNIFELRYNVIMLYWIPIKIHKFIFGSQNKTFQIYIGSPM